MKSYVTDSYTQFMEELLKDNLKCNFIKKYQQEKDNISILYKGRIEFRICKEKF